MPAGHDDSGADRPAGRQQQRRRGMLKRPHTLVLTAVAAALSLFDFVGDVVFLSKWLRYPCRLGADAGSTFDDPRLYATDGVIMEGSFCEVQTVSVWSDPVPDAGRLLTRAPAEVISLSTAESRLPDYSSATSAAVLDGTLLFARESGASSLQEAPLFTTTLSSSEIEWGSDSLEVFCTREPTSEAGAPPPFNSIVGLNEPVNSRYWTAEPTSCATRVGHECHRKLTNSLQATFRRVEAVCGDTQSPEYDSEACDRELSALSDALPFNCTGFDSADCFATAGEFFAECQEPFRRQLAPAPLGEEGSDGLVVLPLTATPPVVGVFDDARTSRLGARLLAWKFSGSVQESGDMATLSAADVYAAILLAIICTKELAKLACVLSTFFAPTFRRPGSFKFVQNSPVALLLFSCSSDYRDLVVEASRESNAFPLLLDLLFEDLPQLVLPIYLVNENGFSRAGAITLVSLFGTMLAAAVNLARALESCVRVVRAERGAFRQERLRAAGAADKAEDSPAQDMSGAAVVEMGACESDRLLTVQEVAERVALLEDRFERVTVLEERIAQLEQGAAATTTNEV